jgi:DNA-binding NtrC family response regulator
MTRSRAAILIVDDEFSVRDSLTGWFRKDGYIVESAENASTAVKRLETAAFDVVLLDIKMPGMDGIELQRRIHEIDPHIVVIMITAFAAVETAVQALKQGAFDYVTKPVDPDELSHLVRRAIEQRRLQSENTDLRAKIEEMSTLHQPIGDSPEMRKVMELVATVASTDATVLIRGESGTGKEVIAHAIHANSARKYFPIVPVNCGALAENLLESELFGHEKGAFTGAQYRRKGRLEMADGGTLFLDEIGTVSLKTQVDLLRVLESKEFTRLGGTRAIQVDFRVISATNQDLERLVETGQFREDLYYRINVVTISLPPLRERRADIPLLAEHFLQRFSRRSRREMNSIEPEAMDALVRYRWPGNVRELANVIERAVVVGRPPAIRREDLPFSIEALDGPPPGNSLADVERAHVERILAMTEWNVTRSAQILGVDRATLYNKIKRYGLERSTRCAS